MPEPATGLWASLKIFYEFFEFLVQRHGVVEGNTFLSGVVSDKNVIRVGVRK